EHAAIVAFDMQCIVNVGQVLTGLEANVNDRPDHLYDLSDVLGHELFKRFEGQLAPVCGREGKGKMRLEVGSGCGLKVWANSCPGAAQLVLSGVEGPASPR